jgi:hypothetical protein
VLAPILASKKSQRNNFLPEAGISVAADGLLGKSESHIMLHSLNPAKKLDGAFHNHSTTRDPFAGSPWNRFGCRWLLHLAMGTALARIHVSAACHFRASE